MTRGSAKVVESCVVVLDNGGGFCRGGFAGEEDPAVVIPNCMIRPRSAKKWAVADNINQVVDIQGLVMKRPMDRGYLINPETEKEIWDRVFRSLLKVHPVDCGLVLVEPLFNLPSIQKTTDEIVFEDFGFQSLYVGNSPALTHMYEANRVPDSLLAKSGCSLVVDSGFSFTHAAPVCDGFVISHGVKRINLGGKALTNYMKELVSYRAWNMMDETYIIEDVKEKLGVCSLDVAADLSLARRPGKDNQFRREYVLPDGIKYNRGFVKLAEAGVAEGHDEEVKERQKNAAPHKRDQQVLTLTNERFLVPEMLFHPADLGMNEAGLAECIVRAVNACPPVLQPLLFSSVILTGGSTLFPGFKQRLELEFRPLVPDQFDVHVKAVDSPLVAAWRGGSLLASSPDFQGAAVTKAEYEEYGTARCRRRFMSP